MEHVGSSRRLFLEQGGLGLGGILLGLRPAEVLAAHQHARSAAAAAEGFSFFTDGEAADFRAFAEQVIPGGDSPGATEANVVYFVDHLLMEYQPDEKPRYRQALLSLKAWAAKLYPGAAAFAALPSERQIAVMKAFEQEGNATAGLETPLGRRGDESPFQLLRRAVATGFLSDPVHGGNKNRVGWTCIGFDGADAHEPPFGYYDAELAKRDAGGDR